MSYEWKLWEDKGVLRSNNAPVTAAPFTMCAWFFIPTTATDGTQTNILHLEDLSHSAMYWKMQYHDSQGDLFAYVVVNGSFEELRINTPNVTKGVWHHACYVERSSTDRELWLDGVLGDTGSVDWTPTGIDRMSIGRESDSAPGDSFEGHIAYATLVDFAMSKDAIERIAGGEHPFDIDELTGRIIVSEIYDGDPVNKHRLHPKSPTWSVTSDSGTPPTFKNFEPPVRTAKNMEYLSNANSLRRELG